MGNRKGVMLAKKMSDAYLARLPDQVYFQPKINGQRCKCRGIFDENKLWLKSSQNNIINSVPHINEQLGKVFGALRFDGELWHPDLSVQEVGAIVRKTTRLDQRYKMINYYIFDLITGDNQNTRFNDLYSFKKEIEEQPNLKLLNWYHAPKSYWEQYYDRFIKQGYEGLIIRNPDALYQEKRTADLLKKKKTTIKEFKIIGAFQAEAVMGVQVNMLGGLKLITVEGKIFSCGAGCLSHGEREGYWAVHLMSQYVLKQKTAVIEYPELTLRGVPHQPILKEII